MVTLAQRVAMLLQIPTTQAMAALATAVLTAVTVVIVGTAAAMSVYLQANTEVAKTAQVALMGLRVLIIQATAARVTLAVGRVTAAPAITAVPAQAHLQANTEAASGAQAVPMPPRVLITQVTAAQAILADGAAAAVPAITAILVSTYLPDTTKAASGAQAVAMLPLALITRVTAAQATPADGAVTAAPAITAATVQAYPQANTEAANGVTVAAMLLPTPTTQATAAQATLAAGLAIADIVGTVLLA